MTQCIITYKGIVYPWHCDHMGHMNVMWYTGKFDEATWQFLASLGLTPTYLQEQKRAMVAIHQEISYTHELVAGNLVMIQSKLIEIREKVILFYHEMLNLETNEIAATTTLTELQIDSQSRKSCPFRADIVEQARKSL